MNYLFGHKIKEVGNVLSSVFPKKDMELKNSIKTVVNNLLLDVYPANTSTDGKRRKILQEDIIAKIKYLDFMMNLTYDKGIINSKKHLKFGEKLSYLLKYVNAWRNVGYVGDIKEGT